MWTWILTNARACAIIASIASGAGFASGFWLSHTMHKAEKANELAAQIAASQKINTATNGLLSKSSDKLLAFDTVFNELTTQWGNTHETANDCPIPDDTKRLLRQARIAAHSPATPH